MTKRVSASPAGRGSARSTEWSAPTAKSPGRHTKTASSAPTALPPASRPRPTRPGSPPCARRSVHRREIYFKSGPDADWKPVGAVDRDVGWQGFSRLPGDQADPLARRRRARAGGPGAPAARPPAGTAADHRRNPWRPELGGKVLAQSRLRGSVRRRRLCGVSPQLPRQCRLGPGIRQAQHRRPGGRRVRRHPCRRRPVRRRGHRRPTTGSASPAAAMAAT